MSVPLTKVDSAIAGLSISGEKPETTEKEVKAKSHRRTSSTAEGVWNIKDLGKYSSISMEEAILIVPQKSKRWTLPYQLKHRRLDGIPSHFLTHR
jgi:hypothetical protein